MFPDAFIPLGQVPATANRLERAAAELRERAGSPAAVSSLPQTLEHLEHAFDHLAAVMRLLAEATAESCEAEAGGDIPPEAQALMWHLRAAADDLTELRNGSAAIGGWAARLLEQAGTARPAAVTRRRDPGGPAPASRRSCAEPVPAPL